VKNNLIIAGISLIGIICVGTTGYYILSLLALGRDGSTAEVPQKELPLRVSFRIC
jgi:hypothetical protein